MSEEWKLQKKDKSVSPRIVQARRRKRKCERASEREWERKSEKLFRSVAYKVRPQGSQCFFIFLFRFGARPKNRTSSEKKRKNKCCFRFAPFSFSPIHSPWLRTSIKRRYEMWKNLYFAIALLLFNFSFSLAIPHKLCTSIINLFVWRGKGKTFFFLFLNGITQFPFCASSRCVVSLLMTSKKKPKMHINFNLDGACEKLKRLVERKIIFRLAFSEGGSRNVNLRFSRSLSRTSFLFA